MDTLLQDIRYGIRMVAKSPGFAAIAILTLALGIGANTALFSVVNGVLLNPLPYRQPDRLVAMYAKSKEFSHSSISYPEFSRLGADHRSFSSMAAFRQDNYNLTGMGEPERVKAEMVSADFFSVLGVNPVAGRLIRPEEDQRGRTAGGAHQRWILETQIRIFAGRARENAEARRSGLYSGGRDSRGFSLSSRQFS